MDGRMHLTCTLARLFNHPPTLVYRTTSTLATYDFHHVSCFHPSILFYTKSFPRSSPSWRGLGMTAIDEAKVRNRC
jgi:hypothetical protein